MRAFVSLHDSTFQKETSNMNRIRTFLRNLIADTKGLETAEYVVIGVFILTAAVAVFPSIKNAIQTKGNTVAEKIGAAN
jgi:Flp pilus assembly pilin Flp